MNWEAIGAIGEVVGAFAVIFTIWYLARQIKDNSREVHQGSVVAINDLINDAYEPIYYNDRNIRVWATGHQTPSDLSEEDIVLYSLLMARLANVHLTAFSQHKYQTLDNEEYRKYLTSLQSLLSTPGGRYWLDELGGSGIFSSETLELMKEVELLQTSIIPGTKMQSSQV